LTPNPHKSPPENAKLLKERIKVRIKEMKKRKMEGKPLCGKLNLVNLTSIKKPQMFGWQAQI
jgi:hypothetical protein